MNNVERTSEGLPPLVEDGRAALGDARKLTRALASDEKLERYDRMTRDLGDAASRAKLAATDAQAVMAHVKRGEGTVGALVMDEAIYDALQELLRDLRHNPWKFFWKE
jgi:phospholipid/cholesterol/gamma-HCH transport system substrate-binding protein